MQGSNVKHFTTHQSFCVRACLTLIYFPFFPTFCAWKKNVKNGQKKKQISLYNINVSVYVRACVFVCVCVNGGKQKEIAGPGSAHCPGYAVKQKKKGCESLRETGCVQKFDFFSVLILLLIITNYYYCCSAERGGGFSLIFFVLKWNRPENVSGQPQLQSGVQRSASLTFFC